MKRIHPLLLLLTLLLAVRSASARDTAADRYDPAWTVTTTDTRGEYVGAPMANGGIGLMPWREPFSIRHVILNHVFDSDREHGVSRVLQGINPFIITMLVDGREVTAGDMTGWRQAVDMRSATHDTQFTAGGAVAVEYSVCALRGMPYAGLVRVKVRALRDVTVRLTDAMCVPEGYRDSHTGYRDTESDGIKTYMLQARATSQWRGRLVAASSLFLFDDGDHIPSYDEHTGQLSYGRRLKRGETMSLAVFGSVCSSRDFADPINEAERQAIYARHEGTAALMARHRALWDDLWQGDIRIEGDDEAQRVVRFALFNLYSSCREGSGLSVPPMGLSSQDYNGHVFWDTEMWMYPPMLLLNGGIARSMIDYRTHRAAGAHRKALAYGYRGVMYPWESDDDGEESTPTTALTGPFEHHVTADVAIACWNYYCVTRDLRWLRKEGFPVMREIADYWVSRAEPGGDGTWSIRNVVGANEYKHGATDNAFTNGSAILALRHAAQAARLCDETADPQWTAVADGLRILRFPDGTTREHATYDGEMIKQADANLLGYPLCLITDEAQLRRDMAYYADKIDPKHGPAMSYSVFCVQYARMGDAERAYEAFLKSYRPNMRAPFGAFAETATSQNPYFMTGAGGLLQAVINGFCGLQVTDEGIVQLPSVLPKKWKRLTVTGVGPERKTFVRTRDDR